MKTRRHELTQVYRALRDHYPLGGGWPEGEWPLSGQFRPPRLEVVVGAILTQNSNWKNVERVLPR